MSPSPPIDDTTNIIMEWALKAVAAFLAFVGGIVSATWAIASKVRGYESRMTVLETAHRQCQSETLKGLVDKLDDLPDRIEAKMESRFDRIHERIDDALMRGKE